MRGFWKWLMRTNARAILVGSVVVLLLAVGWWVRQEVASVRTDLALPEDPGRRLAARAPVRLGVLDYLHGQLSVDPRLVPITPFRPSSEPRVVRQAGTENGAGGGTVQIGGGEVVVQPPVGPDPANGTPEAVVDPDALARAMRRAQWLSRRQTMPGPDTVAGGAQGRAEPVSTLTYHGLMRRPDGVQVGLIGENGSTRFLRVGDTVAGVRVEGVTADRIRLRQANRAPLVIATGSEAILIHGVAKE